jgi:hypothetical protein
MQKFVRALLVLPTLAALQAGAVEDVGNKSTVQHVDQSEPVVSDGIRIDPRHYPEPRHYMKRREVYIVQMEPEIFEKQNQFDNACICYQDAVNCFRRSKTPIDQSFTSRIVTEYSQLLRKQNKLQQMILIENEFSRTKGKETEGGF